MSIVQTTPKATATHTRIMISKSGIDGFSLCISRFILPKLRTLAKVLSPFRLDLACRATYHEDADKELSQGRAMLRLPIYMDNQATTRTDPRVVDAMLPFFSEHYGNAASVHGFGQRALEAVDQARAQVAGLVLRGAEGDRLHERRDREQQPCDQRRRGDVPPAGKSYSHDAGRASSGSRSVPTAGTRRLRVSFLPVDRYGMVSPQDVADAITPETILVSVMLANNEVGTLQPVAEIGMICGQHKVLLHTVQRKRSARFRSMSMP